MAGAEQVASGQDVSLGIHFDGAREPLSMGRAPDENEQTGGAQFLALTVGAFDSDRLEASVTMAVHHPSPESHVDVGKRAPSAKGSAPPTRRWADTIAFLRTRIAAQV